MARVNKFLEGKYKNNDLCYLKDNNCLSPIGMGWNLTKKNIISYQIIDETNKDQYSFWKGALGVALLGNIGAVVGIDGKNKKEYLIEIEWRDGDRSLILIDEKYYKVFVTSMF
ncbi:MAG: hypothetical protein HFJ10_11010 [Lachnospiraceae bacterium]|nr:hypothetical protein [Lachnospiraceae bacterium]